MGVDAEENVYVLDGDGRQRVSIYSHNGELFKRISSEELNGYARKPLELTAMAVSMNGEIFLADENNGKVLQLDQRREKIANVFGSKGKGRGQFLRITALAVTPAHQLVVGDVRNRKIEIYDLPPAPAPRSAEGLRLPSIRLGERRPSNCSKVAGYVACAYLRKLCSANL